MTGTESSLEVRAPWYFRLAMFLKRRRVRGGDRLLALEHRLGLLNRVVRYPLGGDVALDVPLFRRDWAWDDQGIRDYEAEFVEALAAAARSFPRPVALVDCGADIGMFTALAVARFPGFSRVVAFEPNAASYRFLRENVRRLGPAAEARAAAVSDFRGRGVLAATARDDSDWARFLRPDERGPISVERIDDLTFDPGTSLVVKIDVEGGELSAIHGARRALEAAPRFAVGFEAHRGVAERTGIDPIECARALEELRECQWLVAEEPAVRLDLARPFFAQVGDRHVYNVVCVSAGGPRLTA